ncbi:MAG: hypothetical protein K8T20_04550 [Planctomycetes bacterium]|nr:hypothetical protein [Planctomycetota bacterium]
MTVEKTGSVDFITVERDTGTISMVLIEPREWSADPARVAQLEAKLESYRKYFLEGKLAKALPQVAGNPVVFELRCPGPPPQELFPTLNRWGKELRDIGVQFDVSIPPPGHVGVVLPEVG